MSLPAAVEVSMGSVALLKATSASPSLSWASTTKSERPILLSLYTRRTPCDHEPERDKVRRRECRTKTRTPSG